MTKHRDDRMKMNATVGKPKNDAAAKKSQTSEFVMISRDRGGEESKISRS